MKYKLVSILLVVSLLTACSAIYKLEIVNYSSEPVTITYKLKENREFQKLKVLSLEDWKSGKEPKDLPDEAFKTDAEKRERIVTLQPDQAIILEEGLYNPSAEGGMMDVIELKLSGANGELKYSGGNFYRNFEKASEGIYVIEYR